MLRWMTPFLIAIFAAGTAAADSGRTATPADGPAAAKPADGPATAKPADSPAAITSAKSPAAVKSANSPAATRRATVRAAGNLPRGLPHPHYKYRTTVAEVRHVHRSTEIESKLVSFERSRLGCAIKVIACVEIVIAQELEKFTVIIVSARAGGDVHDRAGVAAVLSAER